MKKLLAGAAIGSFVILNPFGGVKEAKAETGGVCGASMDPPPAPPGPVWEDADCAARIRDSDCGKPSTGGAVWSDGDCGTNPHGPPYNWVWKDNSCGQMAQNTEGGPINRDIEDEDCNIADGSVGGIHKDEDCVHSGSDSYCIIFW